MKRLIILSLLLISNIVFAKNGFDYELTRTKEVPGFFMVKIFATNKATSKNINEIFVKNFTKNESDIYEELLPFLQENRSAKVINMLDFDSNNIQENEKIIILGEPFNNFLNFYYKESEEDIFKQFQNFAKKELSPIILQDFNINFGGNVFDIETKNSKITLDSPAIFVGKFKQPMKTRMEIISNKENTANIIIPLDLSKYYKDSLTQYLPEIWQELAYPETKQNTAKKSIWTNYLKKLYPYFLGLFLIFILFIIKKYLNKTSKEISFNCDEEVPVFCSKISESEYKEHEEFIENNTETDNIPFEVIWKN